MPLRKDDNWKSFFASRWFMLVGVILLLLLSIAYGRAYYQNYQVEQEIKRLENETIRLQAKKLETLDVLKYVQSPAYVEEKARTELNLVKNGEHVAIISGSAAPSIIGQENQKMLESKNLSNPRLWWNYFFAKYK